jgi:2-dehydro-3-deoxyphosphooctonate aldolase (KDO 8-P synthase)
MAEIRYNNFFNETPLMVIAGPCQIESRDHAMMIAEHIAQTCSDLKVPFVFKASFDKANRSSITGKRGIGMDEGLKILQEIKTKFNCSITTDIHLPDQALPVSQVADVIQIPAFLCRQTDLITSAALTRKIITVKKGQFLSYTDTDNIVRKVNTAHNDQCIIIERGTSFGYGNLVVDMRGFEYSKRKGIPIVFDGTHSVQQPGGLGLSSGGDRSMVPPLCMSAVAQGIGGVFLEMHNDPDNAPSDGPNALFLNDFKPLLAKLKALDEHVKNNKGKPTTNIDEIVTAVEEMLRD